MAYINGHFVRLNANIDFSNVDHSVFFDITEDGKIYLKEQYRGAANAEYQAAGLIEDEYAISDNGVGVLGTMNDLLPKELVIPQSLNGIQVVSFPKGMFIDNYRLKTIVIPKTITILPDCFCAYCINLEELINTEQIETIAQYSIASCGIKHIELTNCTTIGKAAFRWSFNIKKITIGDNATLGEQAFESCDNLIEVKGGEGITTIPQRCFYDTSNLKTIEFFDTVTSIGNYAFKLSRYKSDWDNITSFGTLSTNLQMNTTDFYSSCTMQSCENPLPVTFEQQDLRWSTEVIAEETQYTEQKAKTFGLGCSFFAVMQAYCGLNNREKFRTAYDLQELCRSFSPNAMLKFTENIGYIKNFISAIGLSYTEYSGFTSQNVQHIYDDLYVGKYVLIVIPGTRTTSTGHLVLAYGCDAETGELLVVDSSNTMGGYFEGKKALKYKMRIQNLVQSVSNSTSPNFITIYKS